MLFRISLETWTTISNSKRDDYVWFGFGLVLIIIIIIIIMRMRIVILQASTDLKKINFNNEFIIFSINIQTIGHHLIILIFMKGYKMMNKKKFWSNKNVIGIQNTTFQGLNCSNSNLSCSDINIKNISFFLSWEKWFNIRLVISIFKKKFNKIILVFQFFSYSKTKYDVKKKNFNFKW